MEKDAGGVLEVPKALTGGQIWNVKTEDDTRVWGLTELGGGTGAIS